MDNCPVHNALTIRLANLLSDALTIGADNGITVSTDDPGAAFSAAVKNDRLNEGYRWVCNELMNRLSKEDMYRRGQGFIASQSVAFSSGGVNLNKDYIGFFRMIKSDGTSFQFGTKAGFDTDNQFFINNGYSIEGGKIYAYSRVGGVLTLLGSGTGTLYYFKADRVNVTSGADYGVNTAPDTTVDQQWLDACMLYAAWRLAKDQGAAEWVLKAQQFLEQAVSKLPQIQQAA